MISRKAPVEILLVLLISLFCCQAPATGEPYRIDLAFNDLPSAPFSTYSYDVDRDGTADVVFKAGSVDLTCIASPWAGLSRIQCPAIHGNGSSGDPVLIVDFLGGATGRISFDFAVYSESETTDPEAYVQVYDTEGYLQPVSLHADGSPAEDLFEIDLFSTASSARIWFYSGWGNAFIMDNFQATVGTTHAPVGEGEVSDFDKDGDIDGLDLCHLTDHPTLVALNSFALFFAKVGKVCPCKCQFVSETDPVSPGDLFQIDATVTNEWIMDETLFFARYITFPDFRRFPADPDSYLNGLITPVTVAAGESASKVFVNTIPDNWPTGTYTYHGILFVSGKTILAECEYPFQVIDGQQ